MKNIIPAIIIAAAMILTASGCEQFSTTYQRVDDTEFRLLRMLWDPVDAAPGDTVTLMAVFAGKAMSADLDNLNWWISFNMIRSLTGSETVVDSVRLESIAQSYEVDFSTYTRAIAFKIPIPKDIVRTSASIPERWTDMLPPEMRGAIPPQFADMTKDQVVDLLESPRELVEGVWGLIGGGGTDAYVPGASILDNRARVLLAQILQFFTVPIRVTARMHEEGRLPHTMVSNHSIRYNDRFKGYGAPVNYAPPYIYPFVSKVKGDYLTNDNTLWTKYERIWLDNSGNSIIEVEDGYTYFLEMQYCGICLDSTITMLGNTVREEIHSNRQFQLDKDETAGIHHSKFMDVTNYNFKITMPTDKRITKFVFWMTATDTDNMTNERLRPVGVTLVEVSGRLVYK